MYLGFGHVTPSDKDKIPRREVGFGDAEEADDVDGAVEGDLGLAADVRGDRLHRREVGEAIGREVDQVDADRHVRDVVDPAVEADDEDVRAVLADWAREGN